jgi:hypothetical protein
LRKHRIRHGHRWFGFWSKLQWRLWIYLTEILKWWTFVMNGLCYTANCFIYYNVYFTILHYRPLI